MKRDRDKSVTSDGDRVALVLDYDGTITEKDLLQEISQVFGDREVVAEVEDALREGRITLRDEITREYASVRVPFGEVLGWALEHVRVRPGFRELVRLARERGWHIVVVSSGFHELIEPVLEREGIEVELKANRVIPDPGGWQVLWRDETVCAVCGQACKRNALPEADEIVYVGDGISDRCATLASDRVFATRGLAVYLEQRGTSFERFRDFFDVLERLGLPAVGIHTKS